MRFKGKVDWWFHAILIAVAALLLPLVYLARRDGNKAALIAVLIVFVAVEALLASIELCNFVELRSKSMYIAFGFIRKEIPYATISALSMTRDASSALAASTDRIEIRRKGKSEIMIAVIGRHRFFHEVHKRAPDIMLL